jgi:PAS domain S-box-containing protein
MQLMAEPGSVSGFEFQMHRKDGGTIWVSENARAIRDANDTLLYYEGTTEDITERKWTEEALRESEHRVSEALEFNRKILNTSSIGILTYNESGQCVSANTAAAKITGGTLPQLLAQNFHEIPSWKKSGMYQAAIRALDTGIEQLLEVHFVTTFGKDGWLSFSFTPFDSAGERHLLVFVSDITEGKQAEQALVESVNKFRWLYEYAPVAYHILTPEGTLTDVNHRWCELLGYPREEVLGKAIFDFVVEQEREAAKDSFEKKKQSKQSFVDGSERNFRTKDGAVRTFKIYDFFSLDERQHIISVQTTIEDITERKQAEEKIKEYSEHLEEMVAERTRELRDAQEELVRKEKLAVLGTLAGGVGHKLRNPLGVISNSVYYLKMVQPDADEKIKKHHAMIDQEVHNAAHIVSDLLDYARVISTDRKTVPVSKLVEHTLSHFPVPASIMVSLKIAVDLPTIYVDPLHVEQVLGNLVTNACQAMSDGGKLIISAREVVPVYARGQKKKMVAIAVKDTGTGITPENKEKLFEALFSTKAKGIGLGLAVSKKLAEANGGRIEVESQVGKGSTFTLYLPVISSDKDS